MIETVDGLRHGQLVSSIAGRDKDGFYLIWNTIGERYIEVVDGEKHPIAKPKKKNLKHMMITMLVATDIEDLILKGQSVKDFQIAAAIRRKKNELEEGDRFHG
ncbi:MAG TPA: KOW domain-containing RNA-binding protein [Bacillota bacterium]|nr:KOW domain-containing RNA-binding protein [Bacillota bacterium]